MRLVEATAIDGHTTIFVASGPAFKSGVVVPPFQNVHVYSLIAKLLGVTPAKTDGSVDSVRVLLRP
ncbi:MAG: hypothetical protein EBU23_10040 [Mycobacteriaceae bacterium]|nr:hypothetical protein [Mycobacteriaceae bacterium]